MDALVGYRVAVTAHRLVREQTLVFERLGATVTTVPLVIMELTPESETLDLVRGPGPVGPGEGVRWPIGVSAGHHRDWALPLERVTRAPARRGGRR
jgi:hypothetical protein